MPWIRRSTASFRFYWILATIACAMVGVSAGYSWWGESAAVVNIVERELKNSQVQMRRLEKRIEVLEQHCFTGTTAADDGGNLAGLELQVDAFQHPLAGEALL